jgi:hypothetical protein
MSVTLLRAYLGFATGAVVTLQDDVEQALVTQGLATAATTTDMSNFIAGQMQTVTQGGNTAVAPQGSAGNGTPTYYQGPLILPVINLGSLALTSYETSGTAPVAGTMNLTEIFVPYWNTWTGIGVLNGTTVGTDNHLVALYGSNGALLANSAVAGAVSAGASVMQNRAFLTPINLAPGRYFLGVQSNGTTATLRHLLAANGSNVCTSATTGVFGTVPATMTVPSTFTTAVGVISQLYT